MRVSLWTPALAALLIAGVAAAAELPKVERTIAGPDGGWDFATFDPELRRLYIARSDGVLALDVDSGQITPHLTDARRGHIALPINGGEELLVTNGETNAAVIVDARTGAVRVSIPTGAKPDDAVFDAATGLVAVMDNAGGDITLIDPKAGTAVGAITVGGTLEVAADDDHGRLFVNVEDRGEIAVIDLKSRQVVTRYPMAGCEEPTGLALSPEGLLLAACANNVAAAVDSATGKLLAILPIGRFPDGAVYDAVRKRFYIPTGGDGMLWVFAAEGGGGVKPQGSIATHVGARTIALDPASGRLYLPASDYKPSATPGGRPVMVPGTFEVVVVTP